MKTLRVTVQLCLFLFLIPIVAGVASASTLTLSGNLHFPSLDGSAQDSDGLADGTFTVDDDLVIEGTIHCNDDSPLPQSAGACPIRISVTGDLTLEAGSAIFAENRRGSGNGGDILLEVGGDLTLHGPDGALAGAVVSTSRPIGTAGTAGTLTVEVAGAVDLEAGSILAASTQTGKAGAIEVEGETVRVAGLVASGPSRTVLSTALSGKALDGGSVGQAGGTIHLRALGSEEPGIRIDADGLVVSQGEGGGTGLVLFEACGIEVRGLVASLSRNNPKDIGPSQVVLRSGKGILVDGRDLGSPAPAEGRFGRVRADGTQQGAAGYLVDLFAESDIQVLGPDSGTAQGLFAVSSTPGDQPLRNAGGTITAISLTGALTGTGNAFETGRDVQGDKGGVIDLQARGDVTLDDATVRAVGGFTSNLSVNVRAGGHIDIRSFQGAVSWTFGVGDVRPTGTGVPAARRGTIEITACTTVDTTGSQFPVLGSAVLPFPVETEGICSPTAPSLPEGEPPLPTCGPTNQPPAPAGGPFSLAENSVNGTVVGTVLANDPDVGQVHTFSITAGDPDGAFAINSSTGEITVADSTKIDFDTKPSFNLTVRATDNGVPALFGDGTVIVNLTNVNEQPTDLALDGLTVNENSAAGTLVGTLSTVDPDIPDSHTYTLLSGGGNFQIVGNQLQVAAAPNYEATQSLNVQVRTTDAGGLSREESFTIAVVDLNEPPTPVLDTYTAFGNTQLVAGGLAGTHRAFSTDPDQVDTNDTDPDTLNPAFRNLAVVAGSGPTSKGGSYSVDAEGRFTYQPPVGYVTTTANPADPTGPDTFSYSLTDGTHTVPGVAQITVSHRIWYVHNNPGTAGDAGDSADPVDTLAEAETKSGAGDHIYVFQGDGSDTGMDAGITLKDGQKLIGERLDLVVAGTTLVDADGTRRPEISDSNDTVSALANTANGHRTGIEIRGLQLSSTGGNAIDLTSADAANLEATIHDVVITGTGGGMEGIDVNAGSTGTATLAIHDNTFETLGTAIDVQRTAGTAYIKAFNANAVSGNTAGTGINVAGVIFDAVPGGSFDVVNGGVTVIGAPGNGVGQSGMVLANVQGVLSFQDLDIFADGGAGLRVSGTGSGMSFGVLPGVGIIEATGGPAVDIAQTVIALPLFSIKSSNSSTTGLALNSVTGTFSAEAGSISNISSAAGTAFQVGSSNATISYAGTISTAQGKGVDLTSNAGSTIALTGKLTLSTGANTGFNAAGGGTVTATDTANTLTSTTGTALNVANTTIGSGGLKFQSISSNGGGNSGIVLNNTGSSGGLTVSGAGGTCTSAATCTGGAIQNKMVDGISLNNTKSVSLTRMFIDNNDGSGIFGDDVTDFSLISSRVTNNADTATGAEAGIRFNELLGNCAITDSTITGSSEDNIRITPAGGVLSQLTISGGFIGFNSATTGGHGVSLIGTGAAQATLEITGVTFESNRSSGVITNITDTGNFNVSVSNSVFRDNGAAVTLQTSSSADLTFDVLNNTEIVRSTSNAIQLVAGSNSTPSSEIRGTISGNVVGNGTADSGSRDLFGIALDLRGDQDSIIAVTNNNVQNSDFEGIWVSSADFGTLAGPSAKLDLTLRDNTVGAPDDNSGFPVGLVRGVLVDGRHTTTVCLDMLSNTSTGIGGGEHFRVRQRDTSTFYLERLSDGDGTPNEVINSVATVEAHLAVQNDPGSTADATLITGFIEAADGFCRKP